MTEQRGLNIVPGVPPPPVAAPGPLGPPPSYDDGPPADRQVQDGYFLVGVKDGAVFPLPADPTAVIRVGPTDHLVIAFPLSTTDEQLDRSLDSVPDDLNGRVTLVRGAEKLAVIEEAGP